MKKAVWCLLLFVLYIFFALPVFSAEKYLFGTFQIPLMVEDENNGVFIELTREIARRAGIDIEITIMPPGRTLLSFQENKIAAIFPVLDASFPEGSDYIKPDEIIYIKSDFIFTKKEEPLLKTMDELEGKRVGITFGYPYVKELIENKSINIDSAKSDVLNVNKLTLGRIDAFVVEEKTGLKAFEEAGQKELAQYDPETPISEQEVYYAFNREHNGEKLAQAFSRALLEMKQDGTFAKIMQKAEQQK